jgi:hypothetical protein
MQTQKETKAKGSPLDLGAELERERERAERLMAALLRAKADAAAARATVRRLEAELAAGRSPAWSHWLAFLLVVAATAAVLVMWPNFRQSTPASVITAAQEMPAPVVMRTQSEPELKTAATGHELNEANPERERAELMTALSRAEADATAATATIGRLEAELAALRSQSASEALRPQKGGDDIQARQEAVRAAGATAVAAMLASAQQKQYVSHNVVTTSSVTADVAQTESTPPQKTDPPVPAKKPVVLHAPSKKSAARSVVAGEPVLKKPVAKKAAAKRATGAARRPVAARSVAANVGPYPGYAAVL